LRYIAESNTSTLKTGKDDIIRFWAFDYSIFVVVEFKTSPYISIDFQQPMLTRTYRIPTTARIIGLHIGKITCYGSLHLHLMADDNIDFKADLFKEGGIRIIF